MRRDTPPCAEAIGFNDFDGRKGICSNEDSGRRLRCAPTDFPPMPLLADCRWPKQRLLDKALARALVCRDGAGRRQNAYRYWLPQKEAQFQNDIGYRLDEIQRAQLAALDPEVRHRAELESAAWNAQREADETQAEE